MYQHICLQKHLQRILGFALAAAAAIGLLAMPQEAGAHASPVPYPPPPAPASGAPSGVGAGSAASRIVIYRGRMFDTCRVPPLATMRAWRKSPYRAVGVYYAGRGRACRNQPHLSKRWVETVNEMGWRVLPIFVGSQSPCVHARNKRRVRIGRAPWRQGRKEGRDAVRSARALGMHTGSALYLDVEAYNAGNLRCARTTLDFVRGWNREVRRHDYVPGFYSSADSGVRHMERARKAGAKDLPSVMWFARWQTKPSLYGEPALSRHAWAPHRRIHQYAGNVKEKYGGRLLKIDRNKADAPVARIAP
ncbi:DUF1906 domain-containing protein [Streptomyces sp. ISL-98]|uniref:DUF1906 domain-containing protein n=1 Tax=Streptomyces sp. ISL-98 TaxID=2819192 RepID=UPI0020360B8C|nr:DUF1906 domain-containing protein [Streptomyces sp. ISL-98]